MFYLNWQVLDGGHWSVISPKYYLVRDGFSLKCFNINVSILKLHTIILVNSHSTVHTCTFEQSAKQLKCYISMTYVDATNNAL